MAGLTGGSNPNGTRREPGSKEKPRKRTLNVIPGPKRSKVITKAEASRRRRMGMKVETITMMATRAQAEPGTIMPTWRK